VKENGLSHDVRVVEALPKRVSPSHHQPSSLLKPQSIKNVIFQRKNREVRDFTQSPFYTLQTCHGLIHLDSPNTTGKAALLTFPGQKRIFFMIGV
jgi:hypothetical protein